MTDHTTTPDIDVPVLIVGGGGAGLTASMLLSQLGVDTLLVNAWPHTSLLPKAHLLNQRTMEILRDLGVADAVYDRGAPPEHMAYSGWYAGLRGDDPDHGRQFGKIESWGCGDTNPAWVAASACRPTNLPQIRLEPVLKQRADELAPGRIRFHHDVTAIEQDDHGVTATVLDKDTGTEYRVRSRYLLGCDGGRTVGPSIGVTMEGHRDLARMVSIHLTADLSQWARDPDVLIRWLQLPHMGLGAVLVPMGPDHWGPHSEEWVFHLNYLTDDRRALDDDAVTADMRTALDLFDHEVEVHLITRWSLEGVIAERFQDRRIFLLGDAAHRHPPTGGLGLNSAIQDAHNLAWKLAAVLSGHAQEALLDTYEPERKPTTARNVQRAVDNALNHLMTAEQLGISPDAGAERNWATLRRIWSDRDEDAEHRAGARRAIASQSMEFDELNIEYGYTYDSDAIVSDGSPEPHNPDPIRIYQPGTRPGQPLPHAWLDDTDAHRLPIMELVRPGRFLLIAGEQGHDWIKAGGKVAADLNIPLDAVRIGHLDGNYLDPRSAWARHREITEGGAILIRPDRFVAWRSTGEAADPTADLTAALAQILARTA